MDELNWSQRYCGEEVIEHYQHGEISRRKMMRELVLICGSLTTASALLAACGGDDKAASSSSSSSSSAPSITAATTTTAPSTTVAPTTTAATTGPKLSVAANDPAVRAADVTYSGPAGTLQAYITRPSASGTRAAVIVIHENRGLTDHIKDVARRVAKAEFIGLAVDLASRSGGTVAAGGNISGVLSSVPSADRIADINAGVKYLETQTDYNGKLGITGFCFGGGVTFEYAGAQPSIRAAVPYYGSTVKENYASTKAAILTHYGGTDSRINASIPDVEATLTGKTTFEKRVWDGAGHAFNNDTGGAYNEKAAVDAWQLTVDWFKKHLA